MSSPSISPKKPRHLQSLDSNFGATGRNSRGQFWNLQGHVGPTVIGNLGGKKIIDEISHIRKNASQATQLPNKSVCFIFKHVGMIKSFGTNYIWPPLPRSLVDFCIILNITDTVRPCHLANPAAELDDHSQKNVGKGVFVLCQIETDFHIFFPT